MIDKVVDLVIAVDQCTSILRLGCWISEELHYIFKMRRLSYWGLGFDINSLGLRRRDGTEGLDLAVIEARGLAKVREANRGRRNAVKFRKRHDSILPPVHGECGRNKIGAVGLHLISFIGVDARKRCILEYASIQIFHDIEGSIDHRCIFAQAVGFRNWDICALQGVNDAEFAFDPVCCFGKQLAWWLLS